jgi:hypothetical protein
MAAADTEQDYIYERPALTFRKLRQLEPRHDISREVVATGPQALVIGRRAAANKRQNNPAIQFSRSQALEY